MRVALDMQAVVGSGSTGLGSVATGLAEGLMRMAHSHEFVHLYPKEDHSKGLSSTLERVFWEQIGLPGKLSGQEEPPDLLHSLALGPPLYCSVPVISTIYDFIPVTHPETISGMGASFYFRKVIPFLQKRADFLLCISNTTRKQAHELLGVEPDRTAVLPMFVTPRLEQPAARLAQGWGGGGQSWQRARPPDPLEEGEYIIAYGTHERRKNFENVIRAYGQLAPGLRQRFPLKLVGRETGHTSELKQLVARKGLRDYVEFTGYVDAVELGGLLAGAVLGVSLSLYEGFGLAPLETVAFGVPSVVSDIPAHREAYEDCFPLVDPRDPGSAAEAIARMINDETVRREALDSRAELLGEYNLSNAVEKCVRVYDRMSAEIQGGE